MYLIIMVSYLLVLILVPVSLILSRWIQSRAALPFLTATAGYFPFLLEAQKSFWSGFALLVWWTLILSVCILWHTLRYPEKSQQLIWRSRDYSESMFRWIDSGNLPEGGPLRVILFHLKQGLIYCFLAFASANFLALLLGSALLNYMNYYVAALALKSKSPSRALALGWNPWSVIRVLAFLYLGIAFSTPTLWLLIAVPWDLNFMLFVPGFAGVLIDLFLKIVFADHWRHLLRKDVLAPL